MWACLETQSWIQLYANQQQLAGAINNGSEVNGDCGIVQLIMVQGKPYQNVAIHTLILMHFALLQVIYKHFPCIFFLKLQENKDLVKIEWRLIYSSKTSNIKGLNVKASSSSNDNLTTSRDKIAVSVN